MKKLALAILLLAVPANADRILCVGDSILYEGSATNTDWCALAAAQRGLPFCRSGVPGKTAANGVADIDFLLGFCSQWGEHHIDDVVFMYGANDSKASPRPSPELTATRLRQIAAKVVAFGSRAHILTPTPVLATAIWPADANEYLGEATAWLYRLDGVGPSYDTEGLRDEFTELFWGSCSSDGVHPTGLACRQAIANYVASKVLP